MGTVPDAFTWSAKNGKARSRDRSQKKLPSSFLTVFRSLLCVVLTDTMLVQLGANLRWPRHAPDGLVLGPLLRRRLGIEDVFAKDDAVVADVNAGAGDELFHFRVGFPAEAAHGEIGGACHR